MQNGPFVSYCRVSTARQGRSGLGLDAQRAAVAGYLNGGAWRLVGEFVEVESGKRADRPELAKALACARLHRAPLVVAKVDRLTRSLAFLSKLLEAGVDVRFCDLPQIEGPTGRFMLQQMAAVAELEAGMIGDRTRKALAAAKAPWREARGHPSRGRDDGGDAGDGDGGEDGAGKSPGRRPRADPHVPASLRNHQPRRAGSSSQRARYSGISRRYVVAHAGFAGAENDVRTHISIDHRIYVLIYVYFCK